MATINPPILLGALDSGAEISVKLKEHEEFLRCLASGAAQTIMQFQMLTSLIRDLNSHLGRLSSSHDHLTLQLSICLEVIAKQGTQIQVLSDRLQLLEPLPIVPLEDPVDIELVTSTQVGEHPPVGDGAQHISETCPEVIGQPHQQQPAHPHQPRFRRNRHKAFKFAQELKESCSKEGHFKFVSGFLIFNGVLIAPQWRIPHTQSQWPKLFHEIKTILSSNCPPFDHSSPPSAQLNPSILHLLVPD